METKRVTTLFLERSALNGTAATIQSLLEDAEICFSECNAALSEAEMSEISYQFQAEATGEMIQGDLFLQAYAAKAHEQVYTYLDNPLYRNFKDNATETISQILDEITTDNTFGMEEYYDVGDGSSGFTSGIRVKKELTMSDFLDYPDKVGDIETTVLKNVETIGIFATMFRQDYVTMTESGMDINECVQVYLTNGEFNHEEYHPVRDILSGVLDVTVVKPLLESIIGYDIITQERLDEIGRSFKLAEGVIGAITLGQGITALKGAGYTGKTILAITGKTMAVDALSDAAAGTVNYIGMKMGIPPEINWLISVATGATVSITAGKYILKMPGAAAGIELTAEELEQCIKESADDIRKRLANSGGNKGIEVKPLEELKKLNGVGEGGTPTDLTIMSRNSGRGNPGAITHFDVDLNTRQKNLLQQLPNCDSSIIINKGDVNLKDLAALTAKTGDEFAMFTRGSQRMIIRGNASAVYIDGAMAQELYNAGFKWSGHTHPGIGVNVKFASEGDMYILEQFNQTQSVIFDSQGNFSVFEIGE